MVLHQDLRRVTDINAYEAACWPSLALEIFYASSDGVTCCTCACVSINAAYFGNKKWEGQKILRRPTSNSGGTCSLRPPLNSVHAYIIIMYVTNSRVHIGFLGQRGLLALIIVLTARAFAYAYA